ncbi:MAG: chemotaxis protein CheD [Spirochaetales bacterium]|nr:chemotaxis protein CheD [Spirochaetales bacterium]
MYSIHNNKFNKKEIILHPGEYFCSNEDVVLSTILGSCISVVLYDETKKQAGLNHFLLPKLGSTINSDILGEKNARYGMYAMEVLINDMMKLGSEKSALKAKVFGGASMFPGKGKEEGVGYVNTQFALQFLIKEGIPVIASNTGDVLGRKIFLFPQTGRVLLRKIHSQTKIEDIRRHDQDLQEDILKKKKGGDIVLF